MKVTTAELYKWHEASASQFDENDSAENHIGKDLKLKVNKYQVELEAAQREIELLKIQLKDKEKIIALLEDKLNSKPK